MSRIFYQHCPLCGSDKVNQALSAKDYTVSKSDFEIWHCAHCTGRFTQHVPDGANIGAYYKSEEYISHSETKEGIVNRLYHSARKITLRSKQNWVKSAVKLKEGSLLDIGAGTGAFAHYMQQTGWKVTCLEPDADARANAEALYKLNALPSDELFTLQAQQFDVVTMWHVLEHVHNLHGYLEQIKRVLKPGGALLIAVPNYTSKDAQHYGEYWAAYDVPRHLYHFSPASMQNMLQAHGISIVKKHPMVFDAFYVSLLSEKYKNGGSGLIGGFWNGFRSYSKAMRNVDVCSSIVYECKFS
ncbi:class I SAM-dependent methyltransferase [uncultured Chitinophaga sp.]|uniref:class I SAM-dependent methyltransferase n=1 Tax=uncultured Chitinophaga sp. TaxID=339340 RepID=UPI0025F70B7A|nr:class I SAM-dependent methyltransferase [uncultured Chitinophaga sp.]